MNGGSAGVNSVIGGGVSVGVAGGGVVIGVVLGGDGGVLVDDCFK